MVDGKAYNWMGGAPGADLVDQQSMKYTSTKTTFTSNVGGKVQMTASFLSPVFPDDLRRQSIPSSYLEVSVKSLDGRSHHVQVYCDVTGGRSLVHLGLVNCIWIMKTDIYCRVCFRRQQPSY